MTIHYIYKNSELQTLHVGLCFSSYIQQWWKLISMLRKYWRKSH